MATGSNDDLMESPINPPDGDRAGSYRLLIIIALGLIMLGLMAVGEVVSLSQTPLAQGAVQAISTSTATVEPRPPTLPTPVSLGELTVSSPLEMFIGETAVIKVSIRELQPSVISDISEGIALELPEFEDENRTIASIYDVALFPVMSAELLSPDFTITQLGENNPRRVMTSTEFTSWAWEIEPKTTGMHSIVNNIYVGNKANEENLVFSSAMSIRVLPYRSLLVPYLGAIGALLFFLVVGLVTLSRTSGLPVDLLFRQGVSQWVPVGVGYRRYRAQWSALTPLERFLLLLASPVGTTTLGQFQSRLTEAQTPVTPARLAQALENLTRQLLLGHEGEAYWPTEPGLARALQRHEAESGRTRLAGRVRAEHPLFAEARQFFPAAGFGLAEIPNDPLAFLCKPVSPTWERQFSHPIYARLFPGQPLNREAVITLHQAAQKVTERATLLFAIVDQTPADSGWIEMGALRADEGVRVIPIDDALIQQGREQQQERQTLERHLRRFLGRRRDLYDVRDPVADRLNFFGRETHADELLEALAEGRPLALFGLRKMGKSSLLQYLRDQVPFPVAHADLQAGVELAGLYPRILASWQRSLRVKLAGFVWNPLPLSGDLSTAFTTAVRDLMTQLENEGNDPRLGLFIDEVELIVPSRPEDTSDPDAEILARYLAFARALRGLVQETGTFSLLVVGVDGKLNRINRWAGQQNPFFQFFQDKYLGPLSGEDCTQMVRNIGRQMGLAYSDEAVTFVTEVSGGHPFLARQLCSAALRALGDDLTGEIRLAHVQEAAGRFIRDPGTAALLDEGGLWGEVTDPQLWPRPQIYENQALLTSLAQTEPQSEPDLLAAGQDRRAREQSLFELRQRAVLGQLEELVRIQFGLFRNWIRRYKLKGR